MVRLDKNKIKGPLTRGSVKDADPSKTSSEAEKKGGELESFSQDVLTNLIDENIPPTPINFQIYFEKALDSKSLSFRKRINELLEIENANDDEHRSRLEKEIKEGFGQIKNMMQTIATIYKNITVMKGFIKKRLDELGVSSSQLAVQNVINVFENDLNKLGSLMDKQLTTLKDNYERAGSTLKTIEQEAIFDSRYDVYNKRYLLKSLESEREGIERYNYATTLMLLKVKDAALSKITNSRDRSILLRNIAKLLLKTSRRSDNVAHYGDGVFAMIMKHTDLESAKKACERIADLIYSTSFFIAEMELDIDIELSIVELKSDKSTEEYLGSALDALPNSGKKGEIYAIGI